MTVRMIEVRMPDAHFESDYNCLVGTEVTMRGKPIQWQEERPSAGINCAQRIFELLEQHDQCDTKNPCQTFDDCPKLAVTKKNIVESSPEGTFLSEIEEDVDSEENLEGLPVKSTRELGFFRAFLCSEFNSDCLNFICKVNCYRQNPTAKARDSIVNTFIRDYAPQQINMSSELRQSLCKEAAKGKLEPGLFEPAAQLMLDIVCFDHYPRFLQSEFHNSFKRDSWEGSNQWTALRTQCLKLRDFLKLRHGKLHLRHSSGVRDHAKVPKSNRSTSKIGL